MQQPLIKPYPQPSRMVIDPFEDKPLTILESTETPHKISLKDIVSNRPCNGPYSSTPPPPPPTKSKPVFRFTEEPPTDIEAIEALTNYEKNVKVPEFSPMLADGQTTITPPDTQTRIIFSNGTSGILEPPSPQKKKTTTTTTTTTKTITTTTVVVIEEE